MLLHAGSIIFTQKNGDHMTDFRIGHGYDVHALADGLRLILGGI